MKSFTRTVTKTFTPRWIQTDFSTYTDVWIRIRSRMRYKANKCFKCRKPFELNEQIGLVSFKEVGNKVMCQTCCKELSDSNQTPVA